MYKFILAASAITIATSIAYTSYKAIKELEELKKEIKEETK